jgi:transposase
MKSERVGASNRNRWAHHPGIRSAGAGTLAGNRHSSGKRSPDRFLILLILDNLATHKNAEAEKAMRRAGSWFLFLPPYSPDLNPIEMAFSKLKAHLRRIGARTFTDMFNAITEICDLHSPDECWNCFTAAGYVAG